MSDADLIHTVFEGDTMRKNDDFIHDILLAAVCGLSFALGVMVTLIILIAGGA